MSRASLCLCLVICLQYVAGSASAEQYVIDPRTNYTCCSDFSDYLHIPVSAGTHTIALVSGPEPPCPGNGWGANLLVFPSGLGPSCNDYTEFTLNGVGDSATLNFVESGVFSVGIEDGYVGDNAGLIQITVDGTPYTVDPQIHNKCCTDQSQWVTIPFPHPGDWRVTMISGPEPPCPYNGWGANVLMIASGLGDYCSDYTWTSLNGVGDSVTFHVAVSGSLNVGIEDGFVGDNQGLIVLEVEYPVPTQAITWGSIKHLYR